MYIKDKEINFLISIKLFYLRYYFTLKIYMSWGIYQIKLIIIPIK